jgi:hypothetical protein
VHRIRDPAFGGEDRELPRSHDELCRMGDRAPQSRESPHYSVSTVVDPLDHIGGSFVAFVEQAHARLPMPLAARGLTRGASRHHRTRHSVTRIARALKRPDARAALAHGEPIR